MWLACVIFRDTQVHTQQQNVSLHLRTEAGVKMKSVLFCCQAEAVLAPGQSSSTYSTPERSPLTEATASTQLIVGH